MRIAGGSMAKRKAEHPIITFVVVQLDHEARLRAIEAKLGIKIEKPDRARLERAAGKRGMVK
jgi:hypothetical protein